MKQASIYFPIVAFIFLVSGFIAIRARTPTPEQNAISVAVLQSQVQEIQTSDLPAQVAALRDRMRLTENAVDNLTKKIDEATSYVKLVFFAIPASSDIEPGVFCTAVRRTEAIPEMQSRC
jgi:hypothetical protein